MKSEDCTRRIGAMLALAPNRLWRCRSAESAMEARQLRRITVSYKVFTAGGVGPTRRLTDIIGPMLTIVPTLTTDPTLLSPLCSTIAPTRPTTTGLPAASRYYGYY